MGLDLAADTTHGADSEILMSADPKKVPDPQFPASEMEHEISGQFVGSLFRKIVSTSSVICSLGELVS